MQNRDTNVGLLSKSIPDQKLLEGRRTKIQAIVEIATELETYLTRKTNIRDLHMVS